MRPMDPGGQESPVFSLLLFPGHAKRLMHRGPQPPSQGGGDPGVYLLPTAEPAAAPAEREGSQQSKGPGHLLPAEEGGGRAGERKSGGPGTSPCRDWVRSSIPSSLAP